MPLQNAIKEGMPDAINVWMSGTNVLYYAHWDGSVQYSLHLSGKKLYLFFPPGSITWRGALATCPMGHGHYRQVLNDLLQKGLSATWVEAMSVGGAMLAELRPGDLVKLPAAWVHHTLIPAAPESNDINATLSELPDTAITIQIRLGSFNEKLSADPEAEIPKLWSDFGLPRTDTALEQIVPVTGLLFWLMGEALTLHRHVAQQGNPLHAFRERLETAGLSAMATTDAIAKIRAAVAKDIWALDVCPSALRQSGGVQCGLFTQDKMWHGLLDSFEQTWLEISSRIENDYPQQMQPELHTDLQDIAIFNMVQKIAMLLLQAQKPNGLKSQQAPRSWCLFWAALEQGCDNDKLGSHQLKVQEASCVDAHKDCPVWAWGNRCDNEPDYMMQNCPRSCAGCSS
eukprot:gnl/MRDRNA2_/MRDRNA2_70775_c0_seq1.p1 gnl/MRDRNA2_/MRDRNA2_70775_c0~~gnl/MRDRNA2_/MRDRNA2_70775_c0_seq1.p1  ORF type:complete len:469 (+),score=78.83 gnl/MRDRNA2_/MRDRNA2_70775_c0_seq1:212-1408(+)